MQKTLLSLPLFQGMTKNELVEVAASKPVRQQRYGKRQVVAGLNQPSKGLLLLLEGRLSVSGEWREGAYRTTETISAPYVIEPERCFGLHQRYQRQYVAKTVCRVLYIPKTDVLALTRTYMVFKLNLLNTISAIAQQKKLTLLTGSRCLADMLLCFLREHFLSGSEEQKVYVTMNQIAEMTYCSRLEVSKALNLLNERNDITLQRGIITLR